MPRKAENGQRTTALFLFRRLRYMIVGQQERKQQLSDKQKIMFNRVVFAIYTDLQDLGYGKAALWYIKRRPVKLFFKPDTKNHEPEFNDLSGPALRQLEDAAMLYKAIIDILNSGGGRSIAPKDTRKAFYGLRKSWQAALVMGLENEATEILNAVGFTPNIFHNEYE